MSIAVDDLNEQPLATCVYALALAIRPDFDAEQVEQQLDQLAAEVGQRIKPKMPLEARLVILTEFFYQQSQFKSAQGIYSLSNALWPDQVLASRRGTPAALGFLFIQLAQRLEIPLEPVIFPNQLLLKAVWLTDGYWGIDPQTGERVSVAQLELWLKGIYGMAAKMTDHLLDTAENKQLIYQILSSLKSHFMQTTQLMNALKVSQLMIEINPDDPYEIRDRGLIYAQLDCEHIALADLYYFVEACPDDPIVEMIKLQIEAIDKQAVTLH